MEGLFSSKQLKLIKLNKHFLFYMTSARQMRPFLEFLKQIQTLKQQRTAEQPYTADPAGNFWHPQKTFVKHDFRNIIACFVTVHFQKCFFNSDFSPIFCKFTKLFFLQISLNE